MTVSLNFTTFPTDYVRSRLDHPQPDAASHVDPSSGADRAATVPLGASSDVLTAQTPSTATSFLMKDGVILPPHW